MGQVLLQTPRLLLRRMVDADIDDLAALDADPEVMRFINGGVPRTREALLLESLPRWEATGAQGPGRGFWIACEPRTGEFLGWFHLKQGHYWPREIEVGYRLRRVLWGQGLATEGTRALISHAFDVLGESKAHATTMAVNTASRRVMEKSGMSLECEFVETRWPGDDKRAVKYSILRARP